VQLVLMVVRELLLQYLVLHTHGQVVVADFATVLKMKLVATAVLVVAVVAVLVEMLHLHMDKVAQATIRGLHQVLLITAETAAQTRAVAVVVLQLAILEQEGWVAPVLLS
jgi:hypothetical protein